MSNIQLECLGIGSLPYENPNDAINTVQKYFNIPFWPQLTKFDNEDITSQFLEGMPSFFDDTDEEIFFDQAEQFYRDYLEIVENKNEDLLEKYAITYSCAIKPFFELIRDYDYAKGQIIGPFTLGTALTDKDGRYAVYDYTYREIIVKTLSLKALWQIKHIKLANAVPIIFIDEPSISQLGQSIYLTVSAGEVTDMIREISDLIKANGGISALHCCGKCDWNIPIKAGVNIISFDAFSFAQHFSLFSPSVLTFLQSGGKIAWGVVPTRDIDKLQKADLNSIVSNFDNAVNYLTKKGIDEKLIIDNSLVTPSCGAGSLSAELAEKALKLTRNLSDILKERYNDY